MIKYKICIIGLGYVGLPLAIEFGKKYNTIGFDFSQKRIQDLINNYDSTREINKSDFKKSKFLKFSNNINLIKDSNFYIICVPTPINKSNKPDLKLLKKAFKDVGLVLKKNDFVILESTVYPGATEELGLSILNKHSKLSLGEYNLGFSPERINPGDKKKSLINIDKIVSANSEESLEIIYNLYNSIIKANVHKVSSIKVAETAKIIENTQRDINIALMNDLSNFCEKLQINTFEVLNAASTKWNFLNFQPGLVGGHCIGVDPYYLSYKFEKLGIDPSLILSGRAINDNVVIRLKNKINKLINEKLKKKKVKFLFMGVTFKENCSDTRNSQILKLIEYYKKKYQVDIYDPYVQENLNSIIRIKSIENLTKYDFIIIGVNHDKFRSLNSNFFNKHLYKNSFVFDLKNIFNNRQYLTL